MYRKLFSDLILGSRVQIPELPDAEFSETHNIEFQISNENSAALTGGLPQVWADPDGTVILFSTPQGLLLRFPNLASFLIQHDFRNITGFYDSGLGEEGLRHLLLDQVLPRLVAHRGRIALHGGGVVANDNAICFVGPTGRGKSTLVADLSLNGSTIMSDDCLIVGHRGDTVFAEAPYPSLRLWHDSMEKLKLHDNPSDAMGLHSEKRKIHAGPERRSARRQLPLAAIFELLPPTQDEIHIERMSARQACVVLLRNSFQLDPTDKARAVKLFEQVASVASGVPVYGLAYPRDFAVLPELRARMLACVADSPARPPIELPALDK